MRASLSLLEAIVEAESARARSPRSAMPLADSTIAAVFPAAMETIHAGYWKILSRAAINGCRYRRFIE